MQISVGEQVYVDNLPAGVTVTSVNEQWFIENHQGQNAQGNGFFFIGNTSSSYNKSGQCTAVGCSVTWTTQPEPVTGQGADSTLPRAGWSSTVTNTQNNQDTVYSDGVTREAWDVNLKYTGSGTYTTTAAGCQSYTTGGSGRFAVNYTDVPREVAGAVSVAVFSIVTVALSTGQVLTYRSSTQKIVSK